MFKRLSIQHFSALSCLAIALLSSSCAVSGSGPAMPRLRPERSLYRWYDDGGEGKVTVRISLTDQIAEFKRGGRDIGWCYVATGKEGHDTRPGNYTITEKIEDKHSNIYGWFEDEFGNVTDGDAKASQKVPEGMVYVPAPMPYWMRLTSYGVGMHGGIIPEPGQPASHGCIRLPKNFVPTLFGVVNVGTPVVITNSPSTQGPVAHPETSEFANRHPGEMMPGETRWSPSGPQKAEAVTYRNGIPVFVR